MYILQASAFIVTFHLYQPVLALALQHNSLLAEERKRLAAFEWMNEERITMYSVQHGGVNSAAPPPLPSQRRALLAAIVEACVRLAAAPMQSASVRASP